MALTVFCGERSRPFLVHIGLKLYAGRVRAFIRGAAGPTGCHPSVGPVHLFHKHPRCARPAIYAQPRGRMQVHEAPNVNLQRISVLRIDGDSCALGCGESGSKNREYHKRQDDVAVDICG